MRDMRMLGNMIKKTAHDKDVSIESLMNWSKDQTASIFDGRVIPSFQELQIIAKNLGITVSSLMQGDWESYNKEVVHCMGEFENPKNREDVLDIIENYLILEAAVPSEKA